MMKKLLEQFFEKNGLQYELWEYGSAREFMQREEETDRLFLDIEMEGISGIQHLRRVLEDIEENQVLVIEGIQGESAISAKDIFYFVSDNKYSRTVIIKGQSLSNILCLASALNLYYEQNRIDFMQDLRENMVKESDIEIVKDLSIYIQ